MNEKLNSKDVYVSPSIEVVEFVFEDSIAVSGQSDGAALWEQWD